MFGTSSQLALEESPTLVRQIQQAMKESEQDADSSFHHLLEPPPRWPRLERIIGKRGLWEASSRDVEGGLLEQMEDVYIPEFDRTQEFPLLMDGTHDVLSDAPVEAPAEFVDIDHIEIATAVIISSDLPTPPRPTSQGSQTKSIFHAQVSNHVMNDQEFEDIDDFDSMPPPSNQNAKSQDSFADIDDILPPPVPSSNSLPPKPRPPAIESVHGPLKKPRGRPPQPKSSTPGATKSPAPPPTKKVAKPRPPPKSKFEPPATPPKASGRFIDIDEIVDSEDERMQALSPSPPRVAKLPASQPLPLYSISPKKKTSKTGAPDPNIVQVHCIPAAHLEWTHLKASIFAQITTHIRSLPPTTNPSKPSWHEKILMYDPIVLEDFTAHLNTVATHIRAWRKATKVQTKAWNKEMKRKGGEEVGVWEGSENALAVERELEAWQVREWCESVSVCCIFGDRKQSGARRGYF